MTIPPAIVSYPRCDACRSIGLMMDSALRAADSRAQSLGEEVSEDELEAIKDEVCSEFTFRDTELAILDGDERLRCPHLETWNQGHPVKSEKHWPGILADYCRFLAERMKGMELYDLWLRAGHRHPASWLEFLCEGEGVFGDCTEPLDGSKYPPVREQNKEKTHFAL